MAMKLGSIVARVLLAPVGAIVGQAFLEVAHFYKWYPEHQLAALFMTRPSPESITAASWVIFAVLSITAWVIADHFFYRRNQSNAATIADLPKRWRTGYSNIRQAVIRNPRLIPPLILIGLSTIGLIAGLL